MKKIKLLIISALLMGTALVGSTPDAAAADTNTYPYLEICNSQYSVGWIMVYSSTHPDGVPLARRACQLFNNTNNSVRIDPNFEALGGPDVDSTKWAYDWQSGYPAGQCINGEAWIDPPNLYVDEIYYNTDQSDC